MRMFRHVIRNFTLLNMLLLATSVAIAVSWALPLTRMDPVYSPPAIASKPPQEEQKQAETAAVMPSDFAVIGEMNLFHPERIVPVDKKAEIPKPELVLYGTLVSDGFLMAFIEDKKRPKTTPGRGRRQSVIKMGDVIGGFTVTGIDVDRVTLTRGDETVTVILTDKEKRKKPDVAAGKQPGAQAGEGRQPPRRPSVKGMSEPPSVP